MNAEQVVAPLRKALRGWLTRKDITDDDRSLLEAIDTKAAQTATAYGPAMNDPAARIALSRDVDRWHSDVATITVRYHRS